MSSKYAYVEQDSASRPLTLHAGDISPVVMREFEEACIGYFESKEVEDDKQVKKILPGLRDSCIRDWLASDRERIRELTFDDFMNEFRAAYLDEDWEENMRRELGGMTQGKDSFWDYTIRVQSKNSLLTGTPSHLSQEKLRHCIEVGMNDLLAHRCANAKANKEGEIKKWLADMKRIEDTMRAERREFEEIAKVACDNGRHSNALGEPSNHTNVSSTRDAAKGAPISGKLPKLTELERRLLFDNEGCLKCCRFFVNHKSATCPNNWPTAAGYRTLTQVDVDRAHGAGRGKSVVTAVNANENEAQRVTQS
jgi:hypothetical protein